MTWIKPCHYNMNPERAQEILDSKGIIEVDYKNQAVWINSINKDDNTAEISLIDSESDYEQVALDELIERK